VLFRKGLFRICAKGATLVEVFITIGILAVVLVSFGALLKMMTRTTVSSWTGTQSSLKRQILAARFEPDMYSANEIQVANIGVQFFGDTVHAERIGVIPGRAIDVANRLATK
jgi:Tfp pilus assembly protein PilV